jgi:hypothetical protein
MEHIPSAISDCPPQSDPCDRSGEEEPRSTSLLDLPPELRIIVYWLATATPSDVDADPERCTLEFPGFNLTAWGWKIDAGNGSRHLVLKEIPEWIFHNRQFAQEAVRYGWQIKFFR